VPAPYSINATLRAVETPQGKRWMFVDVIEDGPTFQAGIHPGELLLSIDSEPGNTADVCKFPHRWQPIN